MKPWETFLEKYRAFGQKPTRESHARLFAPDATIFHPGMTEPMPASQYVDFLAQGLKRLPEFHLIGRLVSGPAQTGISRQSWRPKLSNLRSGKLMAAIWFRPRSPHGP